MEAPVIEGFVVETLPSSFPSVNVPPPTDIPVPPEASIVPPVTVIVPVDLLFIPYVFPLKVPAPMLILPVPSFSTQAYLVAVNVAAPLIVIVPVSLFDIAFVFPETVRFGAVIFTFPGPVK
ncbi:unknown [Clostridium sp. CAG:1219]|nr:unknown [Clostridium sp. CAG:1219]